MKKNFEEPIISVIEINDEVTTQLPGGGSDVVGEM